jgi:Anti-sigma-K factor rskA/Putative zinc-finger
MTAAPHTPRIEELLPAFALGALDEGEQRELEAHLGDGACVTCAAELRHLGAALEELAAAPELAAPLAPGAEPRRQLLARVAAEPRGRLGAVAAVGAAAEAPSPPSPSPRPALDFGRGRAVSAPSRWALLAAAALLLVAIWGVGRQAGMGVEIRRLRGERDRLAARADALAGRIARVEAESARLARTLSIIAAPGVESVRLAAMGSSHAAGRTYVNGADRKAVFYAFGLPALGPDKSYQLWYIDDQDRKTSAGIFGVDARGEASVVVDQAALPVERIQAWVVTVEPRGGRPQPTGPIALAG